MKTKVSRVLVMLEYESGHPDNGEVFDLTALLKDLIANPRVNYSVNLGLDVYATKSFNHEKPEPVLEVHWGGDVGGEHVYGAAHLADVINCGLPDGERVTALRNKVKRLRKKADSLERDAMVAKLEQAAAVRHQHPIARVTANPLAEVPPAQVTG